MSAYASLPVDSVLRCPVDGSVYIRVGDEAEGRCWLAVYVQTAARVADDLWAPGDAHELLATSELPPDLVLLSPVAAAKPAPVADVDLADEMDALVDALFAPLPEAVTA